MRPCDTQTGRIAMGWIGPSRGKVNSVQNHAAAPARSLLPGIEVAILKQAI
jgi:hypothetical protein